MRARARARTPKAKAAKESYRQRNLARVRLAVRRAQTIARYGVSPEWVDAQHAAQGGRCAICSKPGAARGRSEGLCVDHDHETGKPRALLCRHCNGWLGALETPEWRAKEEAYLAGHSSAVSGPASPSSPSSSGT